MHTKELVVFHISLQCALCKRKWLPPKGRQSQTQTIKMFNLFTHKLNRDSSSRATKGRVGLRGEDTHFSVPLAAPPFLAGFKRPNFMLTLPATVFNTAAASSCEALFRSWPLTDRIWSPFMRRPSASAVPPCTCTSTTIYQLKYRHTLCLCVGQENNQSDQI